MADLALVEHGQLSALNRAYGLLEQATSLSEVREVRDQAEAIRQYCKVANLGLAMQNRCARLKLDAERKAGLLLAEDPNVGRGKSNTLSLLGIARHQSSRWQKLATLPEDIYEQHCREAIEAGRELTTRAALQLARTVKAQDPTERPRLRVVGGGLPGIEGTFSTIVADPPWSYGNTSTRNAAGKHYPTESLEWIRDLPVNAHAADDAHLYLWATAPLLREAFDVMEAWGFTYKTNLVWVKPQMGMGNYFRVSHEHVLFGIKGNAPTLQNNVLSWFEADRQVHSRKPDVFLDIVEKSSPGPGLEMFNRRQRMGEYEWTYWGNGR